MGSLHADHADHAGAGTSDCKLASPDPPKPKADASDRSLLPTLDPAPVPHTPILVRSVVPYSHRHQHPSKSP